MRLLSSPLQRVLLLVLVLLLAGIAIVLTLRARPQLETKAPSPAPSNTAFAGAALPPGLVAKNFSLRDQNGRLISEAAFRGRVLVLTFIHSQCHDACPFMVEQIKGALNTLPRQGAGVAAVGISVAPAEDTPASRRSFLSQHEMERRLAFLTGSPTQMRQVWRDYAIQPVQGPVDHSTFVLLIDKRGRERIGFPADQLTPEALAHDIRRLQGEPA